MEAYKWDKLEDPKTWIRILSLEPGAVNEPLVGTLESAILDSECRYDATSYCVGPTDTPHQILLRKQDKSYALPITSSLLGMLRRFRSLTETRRLWIDAVCIDQTDDQEKADQIMLMRNIYTLTRRVLIYLGEPDETTASATELMDRIYRAVRETPADLELRPLEWQIHNRIPLVTEPWGWEPLKDFFCRPWFVRKWTIQECVLPPSTTFHCGVWEVEWDFMNVVNAAIYGKGLAVLDHTNYSKVDLQTQLQQGLAQFHAVANFRNAFTTTGRRYQLMHTIYHFQASRATDLRDHLFALLGLASDADSPTLRPTYGEATVLDNCLRYAWFFLARKNNLEVLYRAGVQGHKLLAPSWVPNWYGKQMDFGFEYAQGPWDPLRRPAFYNIGRGTQVEIEPVPDPTILRKTPRLKGVVIDQVRLLANRHLDISPDQVQDKDFLLAQKRRHVEECDAIVSTLSTYPTGEALETALWKTLICGVTLDIQRAPEEPYAAAYLAWRKCQRHEFSDRQDMLSLQQRQQPFREAHDAFNGDKILGSTAAGYMGMFNKSTRADDIVVAFFGGEFPFVLRPRQSLGEDPDLGDFELIGQCYIHGLLEDGQFDIKSSKHEAQWFQLGGEYEVEHPFQPGGIVRSQ
ncbi:hypothetical protein A1O7_02920 [Cladophialophora yegresii CBS 114405]|uniref:Heterokaryon incompatibility domain-containing protein n=1 Tax=Cladophialophora yegresii CBS 114405 TaxID=1182544 RepID=W9W3G4_9EURO|nr:uncharacterized protein A1O7_02920 [Cladophialophora yegresii CBS 114405]EXJ62483.1 hypothetical protein A1O7_02920 [Cladophialophora yegresii CBS 114405]